MKQIQLVVTITMGDAGELSADVGVRTRDSRDVQYAHELYAELGGAAAEYVLRESTNIMQHTRDLVRLASERGADLVCSMPAAKGGVT